MTHRIWREFRALLETHDPLLASAITEATIGGIAKPKRRGHRPIVIGRVVTQCLVADLMKRVRNPLRRLLERGDQYGLTCVVPAVVRPFTMMAKCAAAGVPWALTDDDYSNAFNAISQRGRFEAARRIAPHAPEPVACMLRAHEKQRGKTRYNEVGKDHLICQGDVWNAHCRGFIGRGEVPGK